MSTLISAALQSKPNLSALPSNLNDECMLIGEARKAHLVWTRREFLTVCHHMLNGNEPNFFLIPSQAGDGTAKFSKAKKARVDRHAPWAWETITGKSSKPASIGFYPRNAEGSSRWAAMDFDAHSDDGELARRYALDAFALLLRHEQLFLTLCTSGSKGWHLFAFSHEYFPIDEWLLLLRQTAHWVGAPLEQGVCEIFPTESKGSVGHGIRAPGVWNPKYNSFSEIAFQNLKPLLESYESSEEKRIPLSLIGKGTEKGEQALPIKERSTLYRGERSGWKMMFAIDAERVRHLKLKGLLEHIFRQVSRKVARDNAGLLFTEAIVKPESTLQEHLADFDEVWSWFEQEWRTELSKAELDILGSLTTDNQQSAFRIIQSFAKKARAEGRSDFPIVAEHLGWRIGITLPGACGIRLKMIEVGAIEQTANYSPRQFAARYRWLLDEARDRD